MSDVHIPAVRSRNMSAIRFRDTQPELIIRRALHAKGYRYSLHAKDLPGTPDLVFPRYGAVLFIHGCFWHGHDCHLFKWPKTRAAFWKTKILDNVERDHRSIGSLQDDWRVGVVWECAIKGRGRLPLEKLIYLLTDWLQSNSRYTEIKGSVV